MAFSNGDDRARNQRRLENKVIEIIQLDGSISLSLFSLDSSTVGRTLNWPVPERPWRGTS